jgi:hypothetical protein
MWILLGGYFAILKFDTFNVKRAPSAKYSAVLCPSVHGAVPNYGQPASLTDAAAGTKLGVTGNN